MKKLFLGVILTLLLGNLHGQKNQNSTLLWSITGPGITHPSYLFGTIHLKDKRAFNFSDSVLLKLEECQAFAMEINLDSAVWYMFKSLDNNSEFQLKTLLGEKEYFKFTNELKQDIGIDPAVIKNKNPLLLKPFLNPFGKSAADMPTFLDAYLYNISRRSGKTFIAVEDFHDQLTLFDKLTQPVQKDIIETEYTSPGKFYTKTLVDLYVTSDLKGIESCMKLMPKEMYNIMITKRNVKMSVSIDSIAKLHSTFIAIGAGHLPGDSGVIELLRKRGFTVRPVYNTYTGLASHYKSKEIVLPWHEIPSPEAGYSIEMPTIPFPLNIAMTDIALKSSVDFGTGLSYFSLATYASKNAAMFNDEPSLVAQLKENWKNRSIEILEYKVIQKDSLKTYEFILKNAQLYFRTQVLCINNFLYMNMVGATNRQYLFTTDAGRFLNSVKFFPVKPKNWELFKSEEGAFEVYFPEKPKLSSVDIPTKDMSKAIDRMAFSSDNTTGIQYLVQYFDIRGMYFPSDSIFYSSVITNLKKSLKVDNQHVSPIKLDEFDGKKLQFHIKDSSIYEVNAYLRGTRAYTLLTFIPSGKANNPEIQTFFNSFKFTSFANNDWKMCSPKDSSFSVSSPSEFEAKGLKSYYRNEHDTIINYNSYDKYSGSTFYVIKTLMSDYFYTSKVDSFFRDNLNLTHNDSLLQSQVFTLNQYPAAEYLIQNKTSHNLIKKNFILKGKELYEYYVISPKTYLNNVENVTFFQSFMLNEKLPVGNIFVKKTTQILSDILSTDSLTREKAKTALNYSRFDSSDMPLLYGALLKTYPDDSMNYQSTRYKIMAAIESKPNSSFIAFLKDHYITFHKKPEYQLKLLTILAAMHTDSAQHLLADYLFDKAPSANPEELFEKLSDSLSLTKSLYPSILKLCQDSMYDWEIIRLTNKMIGHKQLSIDSLEAHYPVFIDAAENKLRKYGKKDYYFNTDLIDILGYINNDASIKILYQCSTLKNNFSRMNAVLALIKSKKVLKSSILLELAENLDTRISFLNHLHEQHMDNLFPETFKTQEKIAEGRVSYNLDFEDAILDKIVLKGIREVEYRGKIQRFYIYRIKCHSGKDKYSYFGVNGPYPLDIKEIEPTDKLPVSHYSTFSKKSLDDQLDDYLKTSDEPIDEL